MGAREGPQGLKLRPLLIQSPACHNSSLLVRPHLPSLPDLMGALRQGGSQVSLEKRPDVPYVVVRDGRVVAAAAMRIHLCMDLREWMASTGLWR